MEAQEKQRQQQLQQQLDSQLAAQGNVALPLAAQGNVALPAAPAPVMPASAAPAPASDWTMDLTAGGGSTGTCTNRADASTSAAVGGVCIEQTSPA